MKRLVGVPPAVRFESHINRMGDLASALVVKHYPELVGSRCWVWIDAPAGSYPQFHMAGKDVKASRFALELHLGRKIIEGMQACHKCDNPPCVNPLHLFEGTHKQNMKDRDAKDRNDWGATGPKVPLSGERHKCAKLTEVDVQHIRSTYSREKRNGRKLAAQFNVRPALIYRITLGYTWCREPGIERKDGMTDESIAQARRDCMAGRSVGKLAAQYGMSYTAMHDALMGKTWKHVPNPVPPHREKVISDYCKKGHPYTPENTYSVNGRWRVCKVCRRKSGLKSYYARKAAAQ